jgi:hypothetical protein
VVQHAVHVNVVAKERLGIEIIGGLIPAQANFTVAGAERGAAQVGRRVVGGVVSFGLGGVVIAVTTLLGADQLGP